ncbi:HAMP domain-containing sensor histidine kinase [Kitasatospora sp. NBC_01287]|uniref:HAMP domain-containing sensor histidine kinase n=1 Tax=Kitasatospora sp. NBC_01287 TaxID=2903573 RepID=UPI002B1DC712|nr:HAMP domain-containing sensor histidine kinase [Kitasatospora sp. NBC_01287]
MAILTAAAVAVAIALSAIACWFLVSQQLYQQVRANLTASPLVPVVVTSNCAATPSAAQAKAELYAPPHRGSSSTKRPPHTEQASWEVFSPTGSQVCLINGSAKGIQISPGDQEAVTSDQITYRPGTFVDGTPADVRVSPVEDGSGNVYVLLTALPVKSVQDSLQRLALILAGVAVVGVAVAGLTGRIVARAALKPVDDLTDVVEHIARTEEVGSTIPVQGNDEIARLAGSFNSMSVALANSRERQTRLIADAGHELRTPLTSLRTTVDLLIRSDETGRPLPPATKTKLLGNMKAQMQELTLLIGDLLQLSRPDSPKPGQNVATVAFHEIAQRAVDRGKLRGPSLVFNVELEPWFVRADAAALERAVMNLLDNAVKYSPPGGAIDVVLSQGRLTVRDHGPGIPADELQYVFDRFWRSPSSRQLPGSGLGLSIVAQTIQDSGGQVALGPAQDGGPGALAVVRLPGSADQPPAVPPVLPRD